ncbi:MAG: class I SAM-dependent methyltransferase [Planctomycetes bacterium]|nr:class I SAM-dependent methyltransferase [Planctomycetota bacterium]
MLIRNAYRRLREHGLRATMRHAVDRLQVMVNEWWLGIGTAGMRTQSELGHSDPDCHNYCPTDYRSFRTVMRTVPIRPGRDVFLDYGSGLGRVLILAGEHPFRRILGVELSHELNVLAAANIRAARPKLTCRDIELAEADATAFEVPPDVTVFYFYNPFKGQVLRQVLDQIESSVRRNPRQITIVYKNPAHFEAEAAGRPWLAKRAEFTRVGPHAYVVYDNEHSLTAPPGAGAVTRR